MTRGQSETLRVEIRFRGALARREPRYVVNVDRVRPGLQIEPTLLAGLPAGAFERHPIAIALVGDGDDLSRLERGRQTVGEACGPCSELEIGTGGPRNLAELRQNDVRSEAEAEAEAEAIRASSLTST